ncbi:Fic family protein [Rhizobacter sp. P5_C2]
MPRITPQQEFDRLAALIAAHPAGIGLDAISQALDEPVKRRTLQRRLAALVEQNRIVTQGDGRSTRYLARSIGVAEPLPTYGRTDRSRAIAAATASISREGEEIRACIRLPRLQRRPVGYNLAFLEDYLPNQTAYLPQGLRDRLHDMGQSPSEQAPAGTFAKDILARLLIDLSWASSRLEGNTYSRLDTERLIEFGQAAEGKDALETQMILNHKEAIEYLVRDPERASMKPDTLITLHALLSDGLMADPSAVGRIRRRGVGIGGSVYLPPTQQLEALFDIVVQTAAEIRDPFEQAFFLMVHVPYLQPFEDVNKRVSRLAANIPFIRHNLCPLSFIEVPQQDYVDALLGVYELNRIELLRDVFVSAYAHSCQHYVAVIRELVPPDVFRLRYRRALSEVVAGIVRGGDALTASAVRARIPSTVDVSDQDHFVDLVVGEFKSLHAGNAVRFGLRPLEFAAWQEGNKGHA